MALIAKWIDWLSYQCSFIAMVGMMVLILVEVFLRGIFGISTLVAQEYTSYILIFFVFMCLAHVNQRDRHIKIILITSRLPLKVRNMLEVVMLSLTLLIMIYLFYWTLDMTIESFQNRERAETVVATPLAIPKAFIPLGSLMFAIQLVFSISEKIRNISSPPRVETAEDELTKLREQI